MKEVFDPLTPERLDEIQRTAEEVPVNKRLRDCFINPFGDRVIVEPDEFVYKGLIAIPDQAKLPPTTGTVIAVPENGLYNQLLGKRVLWSQLSGTPIQFKNKKIYFALQIAEIIGEILIQDKLEMEIGGGYAG